MANEVSCYSLLAFECDDDERGDVPPTRESTELIQLPLPSLVDPQRRTAAQHPPPAALHRTPYLEGVSIKVSADGKMTRK